MAFMIYLDQGCDERWFRRMIYSCSSRAESVKLSGVRWRGRAVSNAQHDHRNRMFTTGGFDLVSDRHIKLSKKLCKQ